MTVSERSLVIDDPADFTFLIYDGMFRSGGIQSIIIRLAKSMQQRGLRVRLVCNASNPIIGVSRDLVIDEKSALGPDLGFIIGNERSGVLRLVAFGPAATPVAYLMQQNALRIGVAVDPRIAVCVLHPREFMMAEEKHHVHIMNYVLAHAVDAQNLVFMNDQCRSTHSTFVGLDLSSNLVVPVPIDPREPRWISHSDLHEVKIVSVGRIVNFKAYNFTLPAIISGLRSSNVNVSCDIFGYGSEEEKLKQLILEYGIEDKVRFHGPVDLDLFDDIVSEYDLFIGMGTAALQAAQLGVPTILAIVDDGDGAHGFIDAAPFGNLGEQDTNVTRKDLKDLIESFVLADKDERGKISQTGIVYANQYLSEDYVTRLTEKSVKRTGPKRHLAALYCRFYIWMAKDNWLRRTVRFLRNRMTFF